jgi:hypothetical protein
MNRSLTLADSLALSDVQTFLSRAARVEEGSVRLIAGGGVLAVYTAILYPVGLLDETPTVLGLRTYAVREKDSFDVVVPIRSLLQRVERSVLESEEGADGPVVTVPMEVNTVTWAGISPPRGGWTPQQAVDPAALQRAADAGIAEVAEAVGTETGVQLVQRVRSEVWSRPIEGLEHIPAGAAFAAYSLGFLGDDEVAIHETGAWSRLTTQRGYVLIKRRAWSLAR